jgi:glutathione peroxidase
MKKLKRFWIVILLLATLFVVYVEIVNRNTTNMTYRQKVLKAVYPAWMWLARITGKNTSKLSHEKTVPPVSFYSLKVTLNNGQVLDFASLKGKKVLLVNTASDCGYTEQYEDLQSLYEKNKGKLLVIGFPANDFKEQEKGTDEEIAQFCKANFNVSFPLAKKSVVVKKDDQQLVFRWLTDASQNGWNDKPPAWNFTKFLVNEEGILTNYFGSSVSPTGSEIVEAINGRK